MTARGNGQDFLTQPTRILISLAAMRLFEPICQRDANKIPEAIMLCASLALKK
jgi:hypothetical protein